MASELLRLFFAVALLVTPGCFLSAAMRLGRGAVQRLGHGACLGLALAVYLAVAVSHFDLRYFAPLWGLVGLLSILVWLRRRGEPPLTPDDAAEHWMWLVLVATGLPRFALALSAKLPTGFDPSFHLLLAHKIQLARHAVQNWQPFADVPLNYPTGSHTLLAVLSEWSGLSLAMVFKDLIPLLGVLTTLQVYLLALRMTRAPWTAIYAAAIYGMWANYGSIGYYAWGGLPNELAMLFFIAMLTWWLDAKTIRAGVITAMAIACAAIILTHHHVAFTAAIAMAVLIAAAAIGRSRWGDWRALLIAGIAASALDAFFLLAFVPKATLIGSTSSIVNGELALSASAIWSAVGYVLAVAAAIGIVLLIAGRAGYCNPALPCLSATLATLFVLGEYALPPILHSGTARRPALVASRFLTDLNYFLPIFAALAVKWIERLVHAPRWAMLALVLLAGLGEWGQWQSMLRNRDRETPPGFVRACEWIAAHTPASTVVLNSDAWTTYLTWRRTGNPPLPASEAMPDPAKALQHDRAIMHGLVPPDAPDMKIVQIIHAEAPPHEPVLWSDRAGFFVVQLWPPVAQR